MDHCSARVGNGKDEHAVDAETAVFIDEDDAVVGSNGPFHPVYADADGTDRRGYFCAPCGTVDNVVDTMARIALPADRMTA